MELSLSMNNLEMEPICPSCGHPTQAGHDSNCPQKKESEGGLMYTWDYSTAPEELKKFLIPHAAEGPNTHELTVKGTEFKIPVSFHVEDNNFYISGVQKDSNLGGIIWGNISGHAVKIKHIELAKKFRRLGLATALVSDLEDQLQNLGVKVAYSTFANPKTVEFFLKNGYKIISLETLADEQKKLLDIDDEDFDTRVGSEEDFEKLKKNN